jgi:hypothetical protein
VATMSAWTDSPSSHSSSFWSIHRQLVQEKRRLLEGRRSGSKGHGRPSSEARPSPSDGHGQLNKTLASLELEQAALRRIPTWPWEPGTLRGVLAALVLPIVIWLIQYVLQRLLG